MNNPFVVQRIIFEKIRLVDNNNQYHNEIKTVEAQKMAQASGLDLVCFDRAQEGSLAFCKIIDYGKWKYSNEKKKKKQVKENKKLTKEIRFSPVIDDNDIKHKVKQAIEFLERGDDVVFFMKLRGRQKSFFKEAEEKMNGIVSMCSEYGKEHSRKKTEGMIIVGITKHK